MITNNARSVIDKGTAATQQEIENALAGLEFIIGVIGATRQDWRELRRELEALAAEKTPTAVKAPTINLEAGK